MIISTYDQYKNYFNVVFYIQFFLLNFLKSRVYFTMTSCPNWMLHFYQKHSDRYTELVKFTVEKVDSQTQVGPGLHTTFPRAELGINF